MTQRTESHDTPPALPPPPRPALILSLSLPMVKGGKIIPQPLWMESQLKDYAQQYAQQVSREATAQQAAEVQRLRADAERYRWLRATTNWASSKGERVDVRNNPGLWDSAIDAAIQARQDGAGEPG